MLPVFCLDHHLSEEEIVINSAVCQIGLPSFTSIFKAVSYELCSVFPGVFHSIKYCFGFHVTESVLTPLIQTRDTRECCSRRATTVGDRVISTVHTAFTDENTATRFQRCFFHWGQADVAQWDEAGHLQIRLQRVPAQCMLQKTFLYFLRSQFLWIPKNLIRKLHEFIQRDDEPTQNNEEQHNVMQFL